MNDMNDPSSNDSDNQTILDRIDEIQTTLSHIYAVVDLLSPSLLDPLEKDTLPLLGNLIKKFLYDSCTTLTQIHKEICRNYPDI